MKKRLIISFSVLSLFASSQEVISTQGDSYGGMNGSVDFTIGEVVIMTGTDGSHDVTQGFHQTNWNFVGLEDHTPDYEVTVFPNPMEDALNIKTSNFENVTYTLYDASGRIVAQDMLSSTLTSIQVDAFAPGAYSLLLTGVNEAKLKTFKLIKHQ